MNVQRHTAVKQEKEVPMQNTVKFNIEIFESRLWKNRYLEIEEQSDEIEERNEHLIFVVRITRIEV